MRRPGKPGAGLTGACTISLAGDAPPGSRVALALQARRLAHGATDLHELGPRALAEFLAKIGGKVGCDVLIAERLAAWRRLTPEPAAAAAEDRFARRLAMVPA